MAYAPDPLTVREDLTASTHFLVLCGQGLLGDCEVLRVAIFIL